MIRLGMIKAGSNDSLEGQNVFIRANGELLELKGDLHKKLGNANYSAESLGAEMSVESFLKIADSEEIVLRVGQNMDDTMVLKGYLLKPFQEMKRQLLLLTTKVAPTTPAT